MKRKLISAVIAVSMFCSSLLGASAYGNISKNVPEVTQQEGWLCAPTSVGAALYFINKQYLSNYAANINFIDYQTQIGGEVGYGNPVTNNPEYIGDDGLMRNYLNNNQTYRPTPYNYTVKYVGSSYNGLSGYLNNMYNALNNNAPPLLHLKCDYATFGYSTDGGHIMVAYSISWAGSTPSNIDRVGVVDPNRKREDNTLSPKAYYSGLQLYNATLAMNYGVCNIIA